MKIIISPGWRIIMMNSGRKEILKEILFIYIKRKRINY